MAENKRRLLTPTKPARVSGLSVDVAPPLSVIAYRYSHLLVCVSIHEATPSFGKYALHKLADLEHIAVRKHAYSTKRGTVCQFCKGAEMPSRDSQFHLFAQGPTSSGAAGTVIGAGKDTHVIQMIANASLDAIEEMVMTNSSMCESPGSAGT